MKHLLQLLLGLGLVLAMTGCQAILFPEENITAEELLSRLNEKQDEVKLPKQLTLATAKQIALQKNPDLQVAQARVKQALARVKQAQAAYYPMVSIGVGDTYTRYQASMGMPGAMAGDYSTYSAGAMGSWLLFNGFSREFTELATKYGSAASKDNLQDVRRVLSNAVAVAYLSTLLQQSLMETAAADAAFNKKLLKDTLDRVKVEAASRSDELNFRILYNNAQVAHLNSRKNHRLARIGLAELMGLDGVDLPESVKLTEPTIPEAGNEIKMSDALAKALNRPDIRAMTRNAQAAQANAKAKFGQLFPTLSMTGDYGFSRFDNPKFVDADRNASIGGLIEWDLDIGGAKRNSYREAMAALTEARAQLERHRNRIIGELRTVTAELEVARESLKLQKETVKLSIEQRDLTEKSWKAGKSTITRLNEAQTALVRAQGFYANSRIQVLISLENLAAATGSNIAVPSKAK